jgi:hypothetical protein
VTRPSNNRVNAAVRPVTPLADFASVAPGRPARYAVRWTVSDHDFPEARFGRIFSRTN